MHLGRGVDGKRALLFDSGLRVKLHNLLAFIVLLMLSIMIALVSLASGSTQLSVPETIVILFTGPAAQGDAVVIWDIRLPRILLGLMAGWCIALTGAMMQSITKNPLADPGILGLSQGSMVMIIALLVFFPAVPSSFYPLAGMVGGLFIGFMLLALVGKNSSGGLPVLLMGIALETTLSSLTMILVLYTDPETSSALSRWYAGSLFNSSWKSIENLAPWFVLSLPVILVLGFSLKSYALGDQVAMAIGEPVKWSRPLILLATVLLTSASAAAVGPIIFLGVMAPHLAEFLSPSSGRARLLLSAMMGGILVVAADLVSRTAASDIALPTGLSVVLIGAPAFIIILRIRAFKRTYNHP